MSTQDLRTVCLFLGPYRNLTTLTASILSLHPRCQVLNHGKSAVVPDNDKDFLISYSDDNFQAFVDNALELSRGGQRGDKGGTITLSHAFDHAAMRETYDARFGDAMVKDQVQCLVWKESLRTSNTIQKHRVDLSAIFARNDALRFLMPIRNPLDTARSNLKTGHHEIFRGLGEATFDGLTTAIVEEIAWFLDLQAQHPGRFFCYFQDDLGVTVLRELAEFLRLDTDSQWLQDAVACYDLKASYDHPDAAKQHLREQLKNSLSAHPEARRRIEQIAAL